MPTASCSIAWAISTSCSSRTRKSPRARSASRSPSAASIWARTFPCAACRCIAADDYLQRLIAGGHRVAVCEQIEDPAEAKKRGPKAVVRRDVVRLVTPGTLTEETLLDARAHNFLTALFRAPAKEGGEPGYALASLDISTGELIASSVGASDLSGELARLKPGEVLAGDDLAGDAALRRLIEEAGAALTPCPRRAFRLRNAASAP